MPIYEYYCDLCRERVEVWLRNTADTAICPRCGTSLRDKLLSAPNVMVSQIQRPPGRTCCGREERCETPSCTTESGCRRQ